MLRVKLLKSVTIGMSEALPGMEIELNAASALALEKEGAAIIIDEPTQSADTSQYSKPQQTEVNQLDNQFTNQVNQASKPQKTEVNQKAAETDVLRKSLDAKYKRDELVNAAEALKIALPAGATKALIIESVIAAGAAEALLK